MEEETIASAAESPSKTAVTELSPKSVLILGCWANGIRDILEKI
jgi:hypothetical protein